MAASGNGRCYCYAIMSSLCFPCQVKVHLLHLTASPHGELIKSLRCQSPVDKTRPIPDSPGKGQSHSPSPDKENHSVSSDCDKCDYYVNFIDKLTSGLCDEKIMRLVYSNPCLVSTDAPNPPGTGGAIKNELSTSNSNQPYFGASWVPPTKFSAQDPSSSHTADNPNPLKGNMYPTWSTKRHSSEGPNAKEQPLFQSNNKVPTTSTNNPLKQKLDKNSDNKPTTPSELMTTDKMLRRSFGSIAKNRQSQNPSTSPSPAKKIQSHNKPGTVNQMKTSHANVESEPKSHKQTRAVQQSPLVKATSPDTARTKWPRNENYSRPPIRKDIPNRELKRVGNPEKEKPKSKVIKCNEEVCEYHPGMGFNMDKQATVTQKNGEIKEGKGREHIFGMGGVDENTPKGGFFEAALVMDFYQPPQLGPGNIGRGSLKRLIKERENELSNPDLGGGVVKQFCGKPKRSSVTKEGFNQANNLDKSKWAECNSGQRSFELSNLDKAKTSFKGTAYSPGNAGSRRVSGESPASGECNGDPKNARAAGKYDKTQKIPRKGINQPDSGCCDHQKDDGQHRRARTSYDTSEGIFYADYTEKCEQNHKNPKFGKVERDLCDFAEDFNQPGAKDNQRSSRFKYKDTDYDVKKLHRKRTVCKSMSDSSSHSDDKSPKNPNQKKSKSPNQHRRGGSGTYGDDAIRVHPQFSEYMNRDSEGFKSKSTGNVVDNLTDIRINCNKHVKKEIPCSRVDKSQQKNGYRDTGTQYDTDLMEETSPNPSPPATANTSRNRFPPKTTAKNTQPSHGQMYYNRPLKRRSFL